MRNEIKAKMKAKKAEIRRRTYTALGVAAGVGVLVYFHNRLNTLEEAVSTLNEVAIAATEA